MNERLLPMKSTLVQSSGSSKFRRKIALISYQIATSRKRTSFHFIAEGLRNAGWEVTFLTVGISRLDQLQSTERWRDAKSHGLNVLRENGDRYLSYIHCPAIHPKATSSSALKGLLSLAAAPYQHSLVHSIGRIIEDVDVILLESCDGVLLLNSQPFGWLKNKTIVYRPSDLLSAIDIHPNVIASFLAAREQIDRFLVPSKLMLESPELRGVDPTKISIVPHGVSREILDCQTGETWNIFKFSGEKPNVMTVGGMAFDSDFVSSLVPQLTEYAFHFFGEIPGIPHSSNIVLYGEQPYADVVRQATSADIGAAFYKRGSPSYLLESSNKIRMFLSLGKPVVCPFELDREAEMRGLYSYSPDCVQSFGRALERATRYGVQIPSPSRPWSAVCAEIDDIITSDVSKRLA
ncbi:hypothetical protein JIR23_08650 [Bradyrhizobium diazoefficiens]|nr:hypothetical protein [Bradyrhizobium diazoefficiens]QQN65740.1 hypothetical protein JIR23_08650 [Bradyrhizobium diazoefficiens]